MEQNKNIIIGAHQLSWGTELGPEDIHLRMEETKGLGCGALELFLNSESFPKATIRTAATDNELNIIGCAVIMPGKGGNGNPLSVRGATRTKAERSICSWIDRLHSVDGSLLVGPLLNVLGKDGATEPEPANLKAGLKTFRNIAPYAAEKGVKIALEPLQWAEMPWPNTVQQILDFIDEVEKGLDVPFKVLGILFDIYHAIRMEENWKTALKRVLNAERLYHVHVAGPNRTPPRRDQHISWKRLAGILKESNWKGCVTIESFGNECDLPYAVVGPGNRPPAKEVITTGVKTLKWAGL
jgi:D-psicose/D-tagatose/L-ribulose 3-epimerase